jgi:hypothetical protein
MLRFERVKGAAPAMAVATLLVIGGTPPLLAHQCVEVEILGSPASAVPGELIETESNAANCGDPARAFVLTWVLVDEKGDRTVLKRTTARIPQGQTISGFNRLLLPTRLRPGIYDLAYLGEAPSDFTDTDVARIEIKRRRQHGR